MEEKNVFHQKELRPPRRVCLRLKEEREKRKIGLEELAVKTKIIRKYLLALEECRFQDLPLAEVYQKNYLKRYVEALGIDPVPFLEQYLIEEKSDGENKKGHLFKGLKDNYWDYLPAILRYGFLALLLLALIFYLGLQVKKIVEPPRLLIYYPPSGLVTERPAVLIHGETNPEVEVFINGRKIMTDEKGAFKEEINLSLGTNTIAIEARKKHGKTTSETRYVVYKEAI
ncbi:MAG: helix-turn-helix domain-containing protein [Candidatus Magasanikbacteria bacterium]|nr:helix-turn-helix domain-containing protein [Candidatus Magasanikbacteria bacterium]